MPRSKSIKIIIYIAQQIYNSLWIELKSILSSTTYCANICLFNLQQNDLSWDLLS